MHMSVKKCEAHDENYSNPQIFNLYTACLNATDAIEWSDDSICCH